MISFLITCPTESYAFLEPFVGEFDFVYVQPGLDRDHSDGEEQQNEQGGLHGWEILGEIRIP